MEENRDIVDINQLFNHWMTQLETGDHYKELTKTDKTRYFITPEEEKSLNIKT